MVSYDGNISVDTIYPKAWIEAYTNPNYYKCEECGKEINHGYVTRMPSQKNPGMRQTMICTRCFRKLQASQGIQEHTILP